MPLGVPQCRNCGTALSGPLGRKDLSLPIYQTGRAKIRLLIWANQDLPENIRVFQHKNRNPLHRVRHQCEQKSCNIASKSRVKTTQCACDVIRFTPDCFVSRIMRALVILLQVVTIKASLLRIRLPPKLGQLFVGVKSCDMFLQMRLQFCVRDLLLLDPRIAPELLLIAL